MTLSDRDRNIVRLVAAFRQLSSQHIAELLFYNNASRASLDRALLRLTSTSYLSRIERRMVGGARGGSGQYVYTLGRRGFFTFYDGHFTPARTVSHHTLAIADTYVTLKQLERAGRLRIQGVTTEPDSWRKVGRYELKPDLFVDLLMPDGDQRLLWIEQDMGTQGQRQIKEKFERYWRAFNEGELDVFPRVLFVAVDDEREKELLWLLGQGPEHARPLFMVTTGQKLAGLFGG